jgi:hypothetical protein
MSLQWPGDIYRDFTLLAPKVADRKNLVPLYNNIATKIRQIDRVSFLSSLVKVKFRSLIDFVCPGSFDLF